METAPASRRRKFAATWCVIASLWMASGPLAVAAPTADPDIANADDPVERIAAWPSWLGGGRPLFDRSTTAPAIPCTPHPAVARIIVPENGATAYGSGTLVDVREQFGLVITNWHVVRDGQGTPIPDAGNPGYYSPKYVDTSTGNTLPSIGIIIEL